MTLTIGSIVITFIVTSVILFYFLNRSFEGVSNSGVFVFEIDTKVNFVSLENDNLKIFLPDQDFVLEKLSAEHKNNLSDKFINLQGADILIPGPRCSILVLEYKQSNLLDKAYCM